MSTQSRTTDADRQPRIRGSPAISARAVPGSVECAIVGAGRGRRCECRHGRAGRPIERLAVYDMLSHRRHDVAGDRETAARDAWVGDDRRIIDVEKEALVVLLEALDALGDRHMVLGFSGQGPRAVRLSTIKDLVEPVGPLVRRRVAALEPDGYTRTGAALRHVTALLGPVETRHRLLLVLSDGKPNDVDEYEGRYGIEDTRQAVAEARRQAVVPFCLTVDRQAPAYLPSIFGRGGYALLGRPELLPVVLVDVVRKLLTA
jgi:nitric oxide reductase NorD protein